MRSDPHGTQSTATFWAPLAHPSFRVIWGASLLGNTASAMRELAAAWLMTSLSASAMAIGMVKAAAALPVLLLALPGGAMADLFDRRRLNIAVNTLLAAVAGGVGIATAFGALTPALLVAAVFVTGIGTALLQPTQQSLMPLLVPRHQLESAIALNGMGLNLSRALGPALAGLLVAGSGVAAAFYANAAGYVIVIAAFAWWKMAQAASPARDRERLAGAVARGARFVRDTPAMRRVLARLGLFVFASSAYWTLLPGLVRRELEGTPGDYGNLLAAIGLGTVLMASRLPRMRFRWSPDATFAVGAGGTAAATLGFAAVPDAHFAAPVAVLAGAAWLAALTVLNAAAQAVLPDAMRGRGMAAYLMVFAAAMSLGSLFWGGLADLVAVRRALVAAAVSAGLLALWIAARPKTDSGA